MTTEDKLKLSKKAIRHTLRRIRENKAIAYHMGVATEAYTLLTAAYAALTDDNHEQVMEKVLPGSSRCRHQSQQEILNEIAESEAAR